jgi:SAM-dependent methyltransferase
MRRVVEPELMTEEEQVRAYAEADFSSSHDRFVDLFRELFGKPRPAARVLDLGCGAADLAIRFARAFPGCRVHGLDGSAAMLRHGRARLALAADLGGRVELFQGLLPAGVPPLPRYDTVICNSLLHHLHEPQVLWRAVRHYGRPGAPVLVMDLRRPATAAAAGRLRSRLAADAPAVLARDFHRSLCAAFEPSEITVQLAAAGLASFMVREIGDCHLVAGGRLADAGALPARPPAERKELTSER